MSANECYSIDIFLTVEQINLRTVFHTPPMLPKWFLMIFRVHCFNFSFYLSRTYLYFIFNFFLLPHFFSYNFSNFNKNKLAIPKPY